jgi:hypothetical protein
VEEWVRELGLALRWRWRWVDDDVEIVGQTFLNEVVEDLLERRLRSGVLRDPAIAVGLLINMTQYKVHDLREDQAIRVMGAGVLGDPVLVVGAVVFEEDEALEEFEELAADLVAVFFDEQEISGDIRVYLPAVGKLRTITNVLRRCRNRRRSRCWRSRS